jgi:hypothetical protein
MNDKRLLCLFALAVLLLIFAPPSAAAAGKLTIITNTTAKAEGEMLQVSVEILNKGDVAAHSVQANLQVLGEQLCSKVRPLLGVNETETVQFEKHLAGVNKGRYPLTVLVDFHDANDYPFSAVSGMTFPYGGDVNPDLLCLADNLTLRRKGELRVLLKNLGFAARNLLATLVLPKELSTPRARMPLHLDARSDGELFFKISNFSARSEARYPVFCFLEYDEGATHYTGVARAVVSIAKTENWFHRTRQLWIGVAILLGVALVVFQLKRK